MAVVAFGGAMRICYIDEAGCTGALPCSDSEIQPIFLIIGAAIDQAKSKALTEDVLLLKRHFYPNAMSTSAPLLNHILVEIKDSDIRKEIRAGNRNERRAALHFLGCALRLLEKHEIRIFGRLYIKGIGEPIDSHAIYTYSVQTICSNFQRYLEESDDVGLVIADSRNKGKNSGVSHSIFTQKFRYLGDLYGRILEMPTFGHSENHAMLQVVDWLASGMLFPMATFEYCSGYVSSVHVCPRFQDIQVHCGLRLRKLQFRYNDGGIWKGGIATSDGMSKRHGGYLFGK